MWLSQRRVSRRPPHRSWALQGLSALAADHRFVHSSSGGQSMPIAPTAGSVQGGAQPFPPSASRLALKLWTYLTRVYPHDDIPVDEAILSSRYKSLDFYYVRRNSWMCLPYVPPGAFFRAPDTPTCCDKLASGAAFDRHSRPIRLLHTMRRGCDVSGVTGRYGPQPSWTPHTALTRYIFYPAGFCANATGKSRLNESCTLFDLRGNNHVSWAFSLREGQRVEITQYGGWLEPGHSHGKGLWANVWRGTGVFLRLGSVFVSLCKMCAVVDMIEALYRLDSHSCDDLPPLLNISGVVQRALSQHSSATIANVLAYHFIQQCPCMRTERWTTAPPAGFPALMTRWFGYIRGLTPEGTLSAFRNLTFPSEMPFLAGERFAIFWIYSFCGVGDVGNRDQPIGLDKLIEVLACMLQRATVVFAANPNDNGLIHQELVDFDFSREEAGSVSLATRAGKCWDAAQIMQSDTAGRDANETSSQLPIRWHLQLLRKAQARGKFASSSEGHMCRPVFGRRRGNETHPFDPSACSNKADACYLWCDCSSASKINGSACRRESESLSFRKLQLVPEELQWSASTRKAFSRRNQSIGHGGHGCDASQSARAAAPPLKRPIASDVVHSSTAPPPTATPRYRYVGRGHCVQGYLGGHGNRNPIMPAQYNGTSAIPEACRATCDADLNCTAISFWGQRVCSRYGGREARHCSIYRNGGRHYTWLKQLPRKRAAQVLPPCQIR